MDACEQDIEVTDVVQREAAHHDIGRSRIEDHILGVAVDVGHPGAA